MDKLQNIQAAYFIGIGGIGMSALARYCNQLGIQVYGYDKTPSKITDQLRSEGVQISFEDKEDALPGSFMTLNERQLIVYTPAIPKSNCILNFLEGVGYELIKRAAFLGWLSKSHYTIAVAGTHGKTTTSTILAHILYEAGYKMLGILGGLSTNFGSNYIIQEKGKLINGKPLLVTEADEFDRSFLHLHPEIAIVTSTDADHLDIYGAKDALQQSFQEFSNQVNGLLVANEKVELSHPNLLRYGANVSNKYGNLRAEKGTQFFDLEIEGEPIADIKAGLPGEHNIENALAAAIVARRLGEPKAAVRQSIASFKGVKRRFERVFESGEYTVIDDYAHHPEEIRALLNAISSLYPKEEVTMIFQPHLFSRTQDFMQEFAKALSVPDQIIINPIYPAREQPIEGVTSEVLASYIDNENKRVMSVKESVNWVAEHKPRLLVIAGAGDIDRIVDPIVMNYKNEKSAS